MRHTRVLPDRCPGRGSKPGFDHNQRQTLRDSEGVSVVVDGYGESAEPFGEVGCVFGGKRCGKFVEAGAGCGAERSRAAGTWSKT